MSNKNSLLMTIQKQYKVFQKNKIFLYGLKNLNKIQRMQNNKNKKVKKVKSIIRIIINRKVRKINNQYNKNL